MDKNNYFFLAWKFYFKAVGGILLLLLFFPLPAFSEEPVDLESYGKKCSQGITIYCLAAGMEEQKSGNLEIALRYYQFACENHSSKGHLRACTPYLSLASKMERLHIASARLESLCSEGNDVICFNLAKEYFKIAEYHRGFVHLEKLCRENFQPPDKLDYGPCYHLGINLKKIRGLKRAQKIFSFDCDRDPVTAQPSCNQVEAVKLMIQQEAVAERQKVKALKPIELAALGMVVVPLAGGVLLRSRRKIVLNFLRLPVPALTLLCWSFWEPYAKRELVFRADLCFIIPAVSLSFFLAWCAHCKLKGDAAVP